MALEPLCRAALTSAPSQFRPPLCPSGCSSHTSRVSHQFLLVPSPCPPISSPWSALHKHVLGGAYKCQFFGLKCLPTHSGQGNSSFCCVHYLLPEGHRHRAVCFLLVYLQGSVPGTELGPVFAWPQ